MSLKKKIKKLSLKTFDVRKHLTPKYLSWMNDKSLLKYSEQRHYKNTRTNCLNYFKEMKKKGNLVFALFFNKEHVGNLSLHIDKSNSIADISIIIGVTQYHNKGLGSEAYVKVINYLKKENIVSKVTSGTMSINKSMIKLFKKVGMKKDGIRKNHYIFSKKRVDLVYYSLYL